MDECIFTWIHCQFILPSISPIAIFGSRSLVFGLRSHLCCQACLATAIAAAGAEVPAANCRGSQNQCLMFPLWVNVRLMHLFGTNSQGFWSLVQKNGTRSVPQTVPERKGVPETTSFGTHEKLGKNCVFWVWKTEKCLALLVFSETALKQQKIIASLALTCAWAALFFLCLDKH